MTQLDIKFGIVESVNEKEHKIRLREIDTNIIGPEFSVLCIGAGAGRSYNLPEEGKPAACLMLGNFLGIVLGSYWTVSEYETGSKEIYEMIRVDDNNVIKYNTSNGEYSLKTSGSIKLESTNVQLGVSPTSPALLGDLLNTWVLNDLQPWILACTTSNGGTLIPPTGPVPPTIMPDITSTYAQQVKVK